MFTLRLAYLTLFMLTACQFACGKRLYINRDRHREMCFYVNLRSLDLVYCLLLASAQPIDIISDGSGYPHSLHLAKELHIYIICYVRI